MDKYMPNRNVLPKAAVSALVNNTLHMLKNPVIDGDLINVLDTFLHKICELDHCCNSNNILNLNFVDVAIILQNAADLYSKKVDLLWDIIFDYQKRLLISTEKINKNKHEIEKNEERKQKYNRKRKTNLQEDVNVKLANNLSFGNLENIDYFNIDYEPFDSLNEWIKFKLKKSSDDILYDNKNFAFSPHDAIYNFSEDYIGRYDQFHSRFILDDIFYLENRKLLTDECNWIIKMQIDTYVINDFLSEKSIPVNTSSKSYSSELQEFVNNFLQMNKAHKSDMSHSLDLVGKQSYVHFKRLSFDAMRDNLRRISTADSLLDDEFHESFNSSFNSEVNDELQQTDRVNVTFDPVHNTLENRSKSCSQDSAFYEDVDDYNTTQDDQVDAFSYQNLENETSILLPDETNNTIPHILTHSQCRKNKVKTGVVPDCDDLIKSDFFTIKEKSVVINEEKRKRVKKQWPLFLSVEEQCSLIKEIRKKKKFKRLSTVNLNKLVIGVTAKNEDYERFFLLHYKPYEDEGFKPLNISDEHKETCLNEFDANLPTTDDEDCTSDSENRNEICSSHDFEYEDLNSSVLHAATNGEQITQNLKSCDNRILENLSILSSDVNVEQEILRKNIRNWQSFIVPKLKNLENKADFDIHEYGLNIIGSTTVGEEIYVKDLMKGKNPAEATRFFIAILQLANTYNVEIKGSIPGKISNESFQIKVLNKTKHHKLLETYQAPSEKRFRESTQSQADLNMLLSSIYDKDPPCKKLKSLKWT